jgi:hypothetical protein
MAIRKSTSKSPVSKTPAASPVVSSTPVRNSAVPPRTVVSASPAKKTPPTYDQIARRAYEIWQSGKGGSQDDNWLRAERELRAV